MLLSNIDVVEAEVDDLAHISYHLIVLACLALVGPHRVVRSSLMRDLNSISDKLLSCELETVNWSRIYSSSDIDEKVHVFTSSIMDIFDRIAPLNVKLKKKSHSSWITPAVRCLIKLKSGSLRKFKRSRDALDWLRYKTLHNLTNFAICKEKRSFLRSSLSANSPRSDVISPILVDIASSTFIFPDHLQNPSVFNNHFIDSLLSSSYSLSTVNHFLNLDHDALDSFHFDPVTLAQLYNILSKIKLTSSGPYDLYGVICFSLALLTVSNLYSIYSISSSPPVSTPPPRDTQRLCQYLRRATILSFLFLSYFYSTFPLQTSRPNLF